jgi:hypothetical protein
MAQNLKIQNTIDINKQKKSTMIGLDDFQLFIWRLGREDHTF